MAFSQLVLQLLASDNDARNAAEVAYKAAVESSPVQVRG